MVLLNKDIIDVKIAIIDRKIKELEKEKLLLIHKE
jgi:hypothetical protein